MLETSQPANHPANSAMDTSSTMMNESNNIPKKSGAMHVQSDILPQHESRCAREESHRILVEPSHSNNSNGHAPLNVVFSGSPPEDSFFPSRPTRESVLRKLSEALLRRSLTKIDLSQRGLQPLDARLVKMALSQNTNLAALKLGYNNLGDAGVTTLAAGIAVHKRLRLLDLGFNNIGDEGVKALTSALGSLTTLYLAGNMIGEDGALAIADCIRRRKCRLQQLYMTGNRIGAEGVKSITEAILEEEARTADENATHEPESQSPGCVGNGTTFLHGLPTEAKLSEDSSDTVVRGMRELFLGGTGLGSVGCQAVSRLLERTTCLKVISLPNCDIGDEEVAMLAHGMKTNKARLPLESIQTSFNNITHRGLESLTNAVWGSVTLTELKIDNNDIGDRGAHQIAAILPAMKALKTLDVGFNSIKAPGLSILMKAVADNQQLQSLSLSGNAIDVPSAKAVAYALAYNSSLTSLFLVHCNINHEGQRHISAGIVSNNRTKLRSLTGYHVGPLVVTLGFPDSMKNWCNEQVLTFVNKMWKDAAVESDGEQSKESELDPLNFLPNSEKDNQNSHGPVEASVVVEVAKKTYEILVANGVDVYSKRRGSLGISFDCPLAGDTIIIESTTSEVPTEPFVHTYGDACDDVENPTRLSGWVDHLPTTQAKSFVVTPEAASNEMNEMPDPARKPKIVEWLCRNVHHLNELASQPFSSHQLWRLHQHYFTPVVKESGGVPAKGTSAEDGPNYSSVPEAGRCNGITDSVVTPSSQSSEEQLAVPLSDPMLQQETPTALTSLPMMKRKISYRSLGDAMMHSQSTQYTPERGEQSVPNASVAKMIEYGHTGHSLPPKTKKARRNRTRISFVPRVKDQLDSYMDSNHEKALVTMRQLFFVEQALLKGQVNPLPSESTTTTHLSGTLAKEAEMIVVDMI